MKHTLLFLLMICACTLQATATGKQPRLTDDELMTLVQKQTFRYFWDFAHPESGLARERSNDRLEIATIGGSGFGVMAIIVGVERGFITREQGAERLLKIVEFLNKADSYHGIWHIGWTGLPERPFLSAGKTMEPIWWNLPLCSKDCWQHTSISLTIIRQRIGYEADQYPVASGRVGLVHPWR